MTGSHCQAEVRLNGDVTLGDALRQSLGAVARLALDGAGRRRLSIIVEELLANLIEHGGWNPASRAMLHLDLANDELRLVLEDNCLAFDPRLADPTKPIPLRGGGAGLALVRAWADHLTYEPGPPVNRLTLSYMLAE
jgi:anti-sigma regulatory factor (Ser/Thr protein kinase)